MRWILLLMVTAAMAGCLDSQGTGLDGAQPVAKHPFMVQVFTPAFNPIEGAIVTLQNPGSVYDDGTVTADLHFIEQFTNENGVALFESFPGTHGLTVERIGYEASTMDVTVPTANITLTLNPVPEDGPTPYVEKWPFEGYIQCAAEYAIITPSCDTILTFAGAPAVFEDDSVMEIAFKDDWRTIVLDVDFDRADHPGIAGLRVSAYAADSDAEVFSYERAAQQWAPESFTFRLEPKTDYGDAVPTPSGAGGFRYEFYPHGHGDDTICDPAVTGSCFLGVGLTQGLQFEAVASVFYHEDAPEGWTIRTE